MFISKHIEIHFFDRKDRRFWSSYAPCMVYLPTKLGDFVRANFCQTFQHHGDPWSIWDPNVPVLFEQKSQELKVAGFSLDLPDWLRSMAGMKSSVPGTPEMPPDMQWRFPWRFASQKWIELVISWRVHGLFRGDFGGDFLIYKPTIPTMMGIKWYYIGIFKGEARPRV